MEEVRSFWNLIANRYDYQASNKVGLAHKRRFIDAMRYYYPKDGDSVLNVWCRTGNLTNYLLERNSNVKIIQMELSDKLLEIAKLKHPSQCFIQTSLDSFPLGTDSLDWVISLETLEHCPKPLKFLLEVKRVLKTGGYFILSCPPYTSEPLAFLAWKLLGFHGEGPHKFISSKRVKKMLVNCNFKLLKHEGTVLLPFGPKLIQEWIWKSEKFIQKTPLRELCIRQFYFIKNSK